LLAFTVLFYQFIEMKNFFGWGLAVINSKLLSSDYILFLKPIVTRRLIVLPQTLNGIPLSTEIRIFFLETQIIDFSRLPCWILGGPDHWSRSSKTTPKFQANRQISGSQQIRGSGADL